LRRENRKGEEEEGRRRGRGKKRKRKGEATLLSFFLYLFGPTNKPEKQIINFPSLVCAFG